MQPYLICIKSITIEMFLVSFIHYKIMYISTSSLCVKLENEKSHTLL
jgi:hypothetical protein